MYIGHAVRLVKDVLSLPAHHQSNFGPISQDLNGAQQLLWHFRILLQAPLQHLDRSDAE
jgi:hypothetical protein